MDRATYEANVYGAIFDALMSPPRKRSAVRTSHVPYEMPTEDGSGCRWLADYTWVEEDGNAMVTVTALTFATDGPQFVVPLNAVATKFVADLEYEIGSEIEARLDDEWLSREDR